MKIGIMTFHAAPNHGAALQAYALQAYLRRMGHEPFFINYYHGVPRPEGFRSWVGSTPRNTVHKWGAKLKKRPFEKFQEAFLTVGEKYYSDHIQLKNDPPAADVYICGSDQVWNPDQIKIKKDEHSYWLDFGRDETRRIAYAASFGTSSKIDVEIMRRYLGYAKRFYSISVREKSGVDLLESYGFKDVFWVPDPTLLLDEIEYRNIETSSCDSFGRHLFSYQIESQPDRLAVSEKISQFLCKQLRVQLYEALSSSFFYNITHRRYIGPNSWVEMLRKSKLVLTNSFHATVFSLIFHKPFIVLLRTGVNSGLNDRILSLLDRVGIHDRTIEGYDSERLEGLCKDDIDWEYVDRNLCDFRLVGQEFLQKFLI